MGEELVPAPALSITSVQEGVEVEPAPCGICGKLTVSRIAGVEVWCLVKVVTPEFGDVREEPVALFNLDSEAHMFQGHIYASGLNGGLVSISPNIKRLCENGDSLMRNSL